MTFRLFLPALSVLSALTLTGCSALDALMGPGAIDPKDVYSFPGTCIKCQA